MLETSNFWVFVTCCKKEEYNVNAFGAFFPEWDLLKSGTKRSSGLGS